MTTKKPAEETNQRAEFEAWVRTKPGGTDAALNRRDFPDSDRFGQYVNPQVDFAWQALCAFRPQSASTEDPSALRACLSACERVIEQGGIFEGIDFHALKKGIECELARSAATEAGGVPARGEVSVKLEAAQSPSEYGDEANGARVLLLSSTPPPAEALRLMTMLLGAFGTRHPAIDDLVALVLKGAPETEAAEQQGKPRNKIVLYSGDSDEPYIDIDGADLWCNATDFTPEARKSIRWMVDAANRALFARLPREAEVTWPKGRDVGRIATMSPTASMRVGLDSDNDVYVSVCDERGSGSVEFCTSGAGGGRSSKTRLALIALMVAMEVDNAEDPNWDWWQRRGPPGAEAKGGG